MKKNQLILTLILVWNLQAMQAQILSVAPGTTFTITSGTVFSADSLTLIPSGNFSLTGNGITKKSTITNPATNNYISQVYLFNNLTAPFSGTVKFNYADGATLNAIPENTLTLNNFDGGSWRWYAPASRDGATNLVTTDVSSTNLKELTLSAFLSPLPVRWQTFTAVKQSGGILLQWTVASGQNVQSFTVQHSVDYINWQNLQTLQLAGNSTIPAAYSYVHNYPVTGNNFYRIAETDLNEKISYSETKLVKFSGAASGFTILTNPVRQGLLKVQVNAAAVLTLHSNDGKLLFKNQLAAGIREIDVSKYPHGLYVLSCNNSSVTIMIQ